MINLLPYDIKRQIRAARTNTILIRSLFFLGCGTAFLVVACMTTYFFITNSQEATTNSLKTTNSAAITSQVNTIKTNLASVNQILNDQISYKTVLIGITNALPSGVIVDSLSLSNNSFNEETAIKLHATSSSVTNELKNNFQESSLFSSFTIESATTDKNGTADYPIAITIHIILNRGAAK